jgi:hypothetical protein
MWYKALIFIGGVAVGGAATFFYMRKKLVDQQEDYEQQIQDVKAVYSKKADKDTADMERAKRIVTENIRMKDELMKSMDIADKQKYRKEYNAFSKPIPEEEFKDLGDEIELGGDDEEDDGLISEYPQEDIAERPYVITEFEAINGRKMYDKTTLNYYDDGILEDEATDYLIDDIDGTIGLDSLNRFGEGTEDGDPDVVFVRNEKISTDFTIVRQHRDYIPDINT